MSAVPIRRAPVLTEQRIAAEEQWMQRWVVNAEIGTTVEDVMDPAYWAFTSSRFARLDRIEVREETGAWVAELFVIEPGRNWATMYLIAKHDLVANDKPPADSAKHEVIWRGQQHKHCVKRLSDGEVLNSGFSSKVEAQAWLTQYESTIQKT